MLNFSLIYSFYLTPARKTIYIYSSSLNLRLRTLELQFFKTSHLLEDYKASGFVFIRARFFTLAAAVKGKELVAKVSQPGTVRAVRVLEANHITVFHLTSTINSIAGKDLESGVGVF